MATSGSACVGETLSIVVDTTAHRLWLCEAGAVDQEFKIAIGRAGSGKRKQGDLKTPTGVYALGVPRASRRFGTFIPIGYPTRTQRQQGFTGSGVGIHGPDRHWRWLGPANAFADWTQGCIAVATDDEIEAIAAWMKKKKPPVIQVR